MLDLDTTMECVSANVSNNPLLSGAGRHSLFGHRLRIQGVLLRLEYCLLLSCVLLAGARDVKAKGQMRQIKLASNSFQRQTKASIVLIYGSTWVDLMKADWFR